MWQELMRPRRVWLAVVAIVAIALGVGVALNDRRASSVKQAKRYFFKEFSSRRSEMLSSWRSQINVDMGKFPPAVAAEALTELLNENAKGSLPPSRYGKAYYRLPRTIRSFLPYPRDLFVLSGAVRCLGNCGSNATIATDSLVRLLDSQPFISHYIIPTLGRIGPSVSNAIPSLLSAFATTNVAMRESMAAAVCEIDPFGDHTDRFWRELIQRPGQAALASNLVAECLHSLRDWESDRFWHTRFPMETRRNKRENALQILGGMRFASPRIVPEIRVCLQDRNPRIRAAAVDALSRIGPAARDDLPRLNVLCDDDSQMVHEAATNAVRVLTKNTR